MKTVKTIFGGIFLFGGIVVFLWGLYAFIPAVLGFNDEISFAGAIAGIGFVAILLGAVSFWIGKWLLK